MVYVERIIEPLLAEILGALPAVLVAGPRAGGKTTTCRRFATTVVALDRELEASAIRADPDAVLDMLEPPVLLDEWQAVPEVVGAAKRLIDAGSGIGRFVLTGSVRAETVAQSWAATGRIIRLTQWGLCERELAGLAGQRSFFDRLLDGELGAMRPAAVPFDLRGYVAVALRGSYPEVALQPSANVRRRWLASYVDQLVLRDATLHDEDRDPQKLRRYLVALANHTAGVVEHKTIYDAAGVTRMSAQAYDSLASALFLADHLPAWHTNRLNRLTRSPKRYLTEAALVGPLLGVDERSVLRNGDMLGRLIDTFVVQQLRSEVGACSTDVRLYHLRHEGGDREVDVIAEFADGRVIAIEIKASSAPKPEEGRHLAWLRDRLGDQVVATVLFHTGPRPFVMSNGVHALPISCLWGTSA